MGKKKKSRWLLLVAVVLIIAIVSALIIFFMLPPSQGFVPGVKVGDEFIFDIRGSWSTNDSNATVPEAFLQLNTTDWYKVTVIDVDGTKVSTTTTWSFENGTEVETTGYIDIKSGTVFPTGGFWLIFASNLKANDILRPSGIEQVAINETSTKEYVAGVTREINFVSWTRERYDADDPTGSTTWTQFITFRFDKQTGMLVQLTDVSIYTNPQLFLTTTWTLKESNVWEVS